MVLTNKVVLITGASSGIGAAAALAFDRAGVKVAIAARRKDKLEEISKKLHGALVLQVDLSDEMQVKQMIDTTVERLGRIDILVNNAASIIVASSDSVMSTDLVNAFRTNLIAPVVAAQHALGYMKKSGGQIINVGSPGFMMGIPYYSPYVCSKAALSAWTRTIQAEWAEYGVIVSEYFPGYIKTDSRPESRIGDVEQDFLMAPRQNFITRHFAKPKTVEVVAGHLVELARNQKLLMHSGFGVRIGSFISNFPSFRLSIATQMAKTARQKLTQQFNNSIIH